MGDFKANRLVREVSQVYKGTLNPNPYRQTVYTEYDGKKVDSASEQIDDPAVILDLTEAGRAHLEAYRDEGNNLGRSK